MNTSDCCERLIMACNNARMADSCATPGIYQLSTVAAGLPVVKNGTNIYIYIFRSINWIYG